MVEILYVIPARAISDPNTAQIAETLGAANDISIIEPRGRTRLGGIMNLVYRLPRIAEQVRPDVILCRDLDTLWAAVRAKRQTKAKVVYYAHDIYQDMVAADVPAPVVRFLDRHERGLLPSVDAAIAANEGVQSHFFARSIEATSVILCRYPKLYTPPPNDRRLCYLGTLHKNRFTKEMIRSMDKIDARLVVAGPRTNDLYDWVRKNAGPRASFIGKISEPEVMQWTRASDVVVTMLNPADPCLRVGLANKVFDAMSLGRAAIGTRGTATGDIIEETNMGTTCEYDIGKYVNAVNELLDSDTTALGRNAYDACVSRYNWQTEKRKLLGVFDQL